jgi:hypothetical protein
MARCRAGSRKNSTRKNRLTETQKIIIKINYLTFYASR